MATWMKKWWERNIVGDFPYSPVCFDPFSLLEHVRLLIREIEKGTKGGRRT